MKKLILLWVLCSAMPFLYAQSTSDTARLKFNGDFRFRAEQDWNSRKGDGTYRTDRSRLRYRARAGVTYQRKWYEVGARLRTGDPRKQQDPQLTLGTGWEEFGTLPIGLEKAYFKGQLKTVSFWMGKNTFPFAKNNELFWSDNVYPEGVYLGKSFSWATGVLDSMQWSVGHFIVSAAGQGLANDAYMQGAQVYTRWFKKRLALFPSFYFFHDMPNIPDGNETYRFNYAITHVGAAWQLDQQQKWGLELDFYHNLADYSTNDSIGTDLKDQKTGWTVGATYGQLKRKGNWRFTTTYAYLQQYAAVDFMAQNDWARWDYSAFGSPDGRLTNLNGVELVAQYQVTKNVVLTSKYYWVEQLVPYQLVTETGSRIRCDIDIKF